MYLFLRAHPDKARPDDPVYLFELPATDWQALQCHVAPPVAPDESAHVVVPFPDVELLQFPSES
jgi:hypothetical protein